MTTPSNGNRAAQIGLVNTYAAKWTIYGWFIGLAYYNWFAGSPAHVPLWAHLILAIPGMFVASVFIGGSMAIFMGFITKLITGDAEGDDALFGWAAFISPVLAFFAAKYSLHLFAAFGK